MRMIQHAFRTVMVPPPAAGGVRGVGGSAELRRRGGKQDERKYE